MLAAYAVFLKGSLVLSLSGRAVEEISGVLNGSHKESPGGGHATGMNVLIAVSLGMNTHAQKNVGAHKGGRHGHGFGQHDGWFFLGELERIAD